MRQDDLARQLEIQGFLTGLCGVERCIDIHLDGVAFRVFEVHRPGVAVVHLGDPFDAAVFGELVVSLQVIQRVQQKRQLIDRVEWQVHGFAVEEYDLMMQLGVLRHEKQPMPR
ncbi:hypothetical protein D3C86_1712770 [compost metagenome]